MVAIGIAVGVIVLLLVLLLVPVRLEISFQKTFTGTVRYLFFRFPFGGVPKEAEEPSPPEETKVSPEKGPGLGKKLRAMLRREGLGGFLRTLQELAQAVEGAVQGLLKRVRLDTFDLYICLGGKEDAAAAAVLYGQVCAAVYSACGAIFHWRPGKARRVSVDLQYQTEEHQVDFSGKASIRLLFLLQEGIILLWEALPFFRKLQANQTERISQTRKQGEVK